MGCCESRGSERVANPGSILAVVGLAAFDGVGAVELFEEDDEGELVLEGEGGEGEDHVALPAE